MKIIDFNANKFNDLKDKKWMLGNNILYKMCSDHQNHTTPKEIRAKIWLIGRAYAASIERRKNKKEINDNFYDKFIEEFVKFNKTYKFDEKLNFLKDKEFNENTLKEILNLHYKLTNFFNDRTELNKRSLASKYLHFHVPIFPIYDSRAKNSINEIIKGKIENTNNISDKEYFIFCNKILELFNEIKRVTGRTPSLREIDTFLIKTPNDKLSKRKDMGEEE